MVATKSEKAALMTGATGLYRATRDLPAHIKSTMLSSMPHLVHEQINNNSAGPRFGMIPLQTCTVFLLPSAPC